jgi:hypothetical protein
VAFPRIRKFNARGKIMRRIAISWLFLCGALFAAWQLETPAAAQCDTTLGVFNCKTPASGGGTTTFDPATTVATLSGGNLVATGPSGLYGGARSIASHSTGKFYAELTITALTGGGGQINPGFVNASASLGNVFLGFTSDNDSVGAFDDSGDTYLNASSIGTIAGSVAQGNVQSIAIDFGGKLIWYRINAGNWNNSGTANPATGVGGFSFSTINAGPYYLAVELQNNTTTVTANFGATSYAHFDSTVTGFGNW